MIDNDYLVSIGVCGNYLFTGSYGTKISQYLLNDKSNPSILTRFYPYNNNKNQFIGLNSLIQCSDYYQPNFIILTLRSLANELYIRVINTKVNAINAIMYDMPISPQLFPYSTGSVNFLNSYTITTIGSDDPWIKSYNLRKPEIVVPKMSLKDYQSMIKIWGTDTFDLYILAQNENMLVNTTVITLRRTNSGSHDNDEGYQYNNEDNT